MGVPRMWGYLEFANGSKKTYSHDYASDDNAERAFDNARAQAGIVKGTLILEDHNENAPCVQIARQEWGQDDG